MTRYTNAPLSDGCLGPAVFMFLLSLAVLAVMGAQWIWRMM